MMISWRLCPHLTRTWTNLTGSMPPYWLQAYRMAMQALLTREPNRVIAVDRRSLMGFASGERGVDVWKAAAGGFACEGAFQ